MKEIYGWGRTNKSLSFYSSVDDDFSSESRGALTVGRHKSYGDSSLNSGGQLLYVDRAGSISVDPETQIAVCGAGVTVDTLVNKTLPNGLYPYVVPGTAQITLGGAFASDVHGKSHQVDLTFSNHVNSILLKTADGSIRNIEKNGKDAEIFWATAGGMGLTGSILSMSMNLKKVESNYVIVKNTRFSDFDNLLSEMSRTNINFPYSVAWLDLSGRFEGRGILTQGRHAKVEELGQKHKFNHGTLTSKNSFTLPKAFPAFLTNPSSITIFNTSWYQKPLKQGIQNLQNFMHPLDRISNWNVIYGNKGFIQYQFVIPFHEVNFIKVLLKEFKKIHAHSFVCVLKNFGEQSSGHLSFPQPGWSLSVDLSTRIEDLSFTLDKLDEKLLEAGGRIYLAKDSRMNSKHLEIMYPRLNEWRKIRYELDPRKLWNSDQSRRLGIC